MRVRGPRTGWRRALVGMSLAAVVVVAASQVAASPSPSPPTSRVPSALASPTRSPAAPPPSPTATPSTSPSPAPSASPPAALAPAGIATTLLAASAQVTGFSYAGSKTVSTRAGQVAALEFTFSSAAFLGLDLKMPCSGHLWLELYQPAASSAGTTGRLTVDVVSFQATFNGRPATYTPSAPPSAQPIPSGTGTLSGLNLASVSMLAGQVDLRGAASRAHSC